MIIDGDDDKLVAFMESHKKSNRWIIRTILMTTKPLRNWSIIYNVYEGLASILREDSKHGQI